jgi:DDE domain
VLTHGRRPLHYRLSLRDSAEMLAERGLDVYPSTIWRWVQRFVPEFEKRWDRLRKPVGCSWRVDETYVQIRGRGCYLYRAVDKQGRTVDFLLRRDRGIADAQGTLFTWLRAGGLFSSQDSASTWQPVDTGEALRRSGVEAGRGSLVTDPHHPGRVYLGNSGVIRIDAGAR